MDRFLLKTKYLILNAFLFLFPFLFLPITQEFFLTNKLYLLGFFSLILILLSAFELLIRKKISWKANNLDFPVGLFVFSVLLSALISSTNRVGSLFNLNFGLIMFFALLILYFYLSRSMLAIKQLGNIIIYTSGLAALLTIFFFFQPFQNISLPLSLQILKNIDFTPLGSKLDLLVYLGFGLIFGTYRVLQKRPNLYFNLGFLIINFLAIIFTVNNFFKLPIFLTPLNLSWYASLEILKNLRTAFFGIGLDNFSLIFTKVKDFGYNQSPLWQIYSFNIARNSFIHIFSVTGIIGLASFSYLLFAAIKETLTENVNKFLFISLFVYLFICLFFLPPSLMIFYLMFVLLSVFAQEKSHSNKEADLGELPFVYFGFSLLLMIIVTVFGYLLGRSYLAETYFKKAISAFSQNNATEIFNNLKTARILNPYDEKYILNFSQTNLLIADTIAGKKPEDITEQDRQMIAQTIQTAISEAKELVRLNPYRATAYENLAQVYRNIISITNGADAWAISSYQKAIVLDPLNPAYRLNLGGIYYRLARYQDAINSFEQAISFKTNWPNGYYNLAWAYYQNKQYDRAATAMENVTKLINKNSTPQDFEKAAKDLEGFKKRLADEDKQATGESQLNLPQQPTSELDPKLDLPPEASPEAR